jgi:thiamine-phosphate pyrophosphorylase
LHVGQEDAPVSLVRRVLGKNKLIGLSCHSFEQIKKAQREDVNYLGFGPVFKTLTKPEASPRGIVAFKKSLRVSRWPIFAIGGITSENLNKFSGVNNLRIACIREICCAHNPTMTTQQLKERLRHV